MKKFLIGIAVLAVVVLAVVIALPFLVPVEQYRGRIEAAVTGQTGRAFQIEGPMRLSLVPALALEMNQVRFAGPPGARTEDMARLGRLDLKLKTWPLLRGEVEVERLVLVEPDIALEVDAQGVPNWQFGQPAETPPPPDGAPAPDQPGARQLPELRFGEVEVVDGRVSYFDARTGAEYVATDVDASLDLPSLDQPAALNGRLLFRDRPVSVAATAATPRALIETGASAVTLAVTSDPATLSFDGQVDGTAGRAQGALATRIASTSDLIAWVTGQAPQALPIQRADLSGNLDATAERVALSGAQFALGDIEGRGDLAAALAGPRPKLSGALDLGRINLDRYLGEAPGTTPQPAAPAQPAGQQPPPAETGGWSTEPIDFTPLRAADADIRASVAGLTVRGVDVGATDLAVALTDGRLRATLGETALFDGSVSGEMTADATAAVPALGLDLRINGVQAEPVLTRFAGQDRLSGTTRAQMRLNTTGNSQLAMVQALNGQGALTFTDGAIKGVNLAAMVRNATALIEGRPIEENVPPQTDFAELGGNFTIQNGVVRNDDLRLLAPLLRVDGRGSVALPQRTVDFRLEPRLVATIEGQGGRQDASGLMVPVLVRGTFDNLSFTPDLSGLAEQALRDPQAVRQQVEQLRGALDGQKPADAVRGMVEGLLGGQEPAQQQQGESAPPPPANPMQQLKGLFGR